MVKIFIDPGHGGSDSGAKGNGLLEKNLTLAISLKIRDLLANYQNVQVRMSRDSDKTLALNQRTQMANAWGADYLVSVHINAAGGTGYEDYVFSRASSTSVQYQNIMHAEIMRQIDLMDRGKKRASFHMIRESNMPAILTENGFIDHPEDAAKLKQSTFIDKIAQGHVNGLVKIFNLQAKTEPKPTPERKLSGMIPKWESWQWQEAEEIFRKARERGVITSDEWEKKAAAKNLTFDDLEYLNLVLSGRTL